MVESRSPPLADVPRLARGVSEAIPVPVTANPFSLVDELPEPATAALRPLRAVRIHLPAPSRHERPRVSRRQAAVRW